MELGKKGKGRGDGWFAHLACSVGRLGKGIYQFKDWSLEQYEDLSWVRIDLKGLGKCHLILQLSH